MIRPAEGDVRLPDAAATARLGAAVSQALRAGEAVCLRGVLGAGKTTLARGLIRARLGGVEDVPSPTFSLAHFDLYRLASAADAVEVGLDEALEDGAVIIEWPERLGRRLPHDRLDIELLIEGAPPAERRLARLTPHGAWEGRPIEY
jgi:tRNA threonylcarbamoyladenosine biosynthesis protein TsaE